MDKQTGITVAFGGLAVLVVLSVLVGGAVAGEYTNVNSTDSPINETINTAGNTSLLAVTGENITNSTADVTVYGVDSGGNHTQLTTGTLETNESNGTYTDEVLFDSLNFTAYEQHKVEVRLDGADNLSIDHVTESYTYATTDSIIAGDSATYQDVSGNVSAWVNTTNDTAVLDVLVENITNDTASVTLYGANATGDPLTVVSIGSLNTSANDTDSVSFDSFDPTRYDLHYVRVVMDGADSFSITESDTTTSGGSGGIGGSSNTLTLAVVALGAAVLLFMGYKDE